MREANRQAFIQAMRFNREGEILVVKYIVAFKLRDTKGLLYHEKTDAHELIKYIAKILSDGGQIKGVEIEAEPLGN